jgi:tetratricopeptide (TPR) repeat protein
MNEKSVDEISKQYNKILSAADKYFDDQKYHKAKDLYERALTIKPGDDYPKQRLEEIEKILNPNKNIASSGGMKNYGNPDRSTNSVDVEALLLESEKQRRWISNKKASKQREDNEELLESLDILQEGHTFETKGEVEQMQVDLSQKQWSGEVQRSEAELMVEDLEVEMADVYDIWGVDNNDVVQLNRQAAQNIEIETSRINENSELARVEYIGDVELIKLEVSDEINSSTREQTDVVMENKEYVNRIEDEHVIKDLNNDVDRKNTEIHVEDLNIEIINKNLVKIWDQEDEVMNVKDMTELLTDERVASWVNSDIPRIDDVEDMKVLKVEFEETKRNQGNGQYDVTIEAKEYTEDMTTEMELENMNNDLPRQETEVAVENSEIEIGEFHDNLSAEQNNQLMNDKNELVDIEIEIEKNRTTYDQNREGYEVTVEEINEKLIDKHETDVENTTDESYATVDKVDGMIDKQINFGNEADSKSENNTDETISAVEDIIEKNGEISDGTDQHLAENEDYIESLKDINPNQIDEKMKNRLGTEFPEGVTEEIYTNKDEDGLMISYIVRRVVVRNGVGNFYEKVQTRFGTVSYSMNGKGITEFQWQNDTEAADLVRN